MIKKDKLDKKEKKKKNITLLTNVRLKNQEMGSKRISMVEFVLRICNT